MRRQRLDPKHVRDFFYHHALSVRVLTLFFDGIWWLLTTGFYQSLFWLGQFCGAVFPVWFVVNERQRKLHTFVVGRTGVGKAKAAAPIAAMFNP